MAVVWWMDKTDHLSHPQASVRSNYNNWAQKIHWNALQGALFRLSPLVYFLFFLCCFFCPPWSIIKSLHYTQPPFPPFWKLYREVPSIRFKFIHSTQNLQNLNDLLISKQCLKARAMQADATNCTHPIENPEKVQRWQHMAQLHMVFIPSPHVYSMSYRWTLT